MSTRLNVLIVEDSESDAALVIRQLEKAHYEAEFERVETPDQMKRALKKQEWDLVLSDHRLPHFSSVAALALLKKSGLDIPFIVISGTIGEETAVELMKAGAHDYIMKDNLKRLLPAIDRELKEAKIRREHRIAEVALQESEKKYRDLVHNALVGIFRTSLEGDILYVNQAMWRMFEFGSAEELMRERLLNRYKNPIERQRFLECLQRSGSVDGFEMEVLTKTGRTKNVVMSATLNGNLVSGMVMDITARRRGEEDVRRLLAWQEAIFEGSRDAIFVSDKDSQLVSVNQAACQLTGYLKEELLRMRIPDLHQAEDLGAYLKFHDQIMGGEEIVSEAKLRQKNGQKVDVEFTNNRIVIDGVGYMHTTARDITERKRAEEKIALLAHTVKSISECVSITDLDDTVLFVNHAFLTTYGYDEQELLGKNIKIVRSTNNPPKIVQGINTATLGGGWQGELLNRTKDGREFPVSLSTSFVRDDSGQPIALVGVATDITERKRAEKELLESEAKYRTLVTQSPDGIFIVDLSGTFLSVNKAMCDNLKYSEEEFFSMKMWDIVPQQYLSLHKNRLADIIKGNGKKEAAEYEVKGKDGIAHFIEVLSAPYYKDKEIIGFQGIARDVTERKQAEAALRESEEKYRELVENISDIIYEIDPRGVFTYVSPAIRDLFEFEPKDLIGKSFIEFVCPDDRELISQSFSGLLKGVEYPMDYRVTTKSGEVRWVRTRTKPMMKAGTFLGARGTLIDVTDRKVAGQELEQERNLLRTLIDAIPDEIAVKDTERRFVLVNAAAVRALKRATADEIIGRKDEDLIPESFAREAMEMEEKVLATGRPFFNNVGKSQINAATGEIDRCILISKIPLQDQSGKVTGLVGINRDVAELKQAEVMLEKERTLLLTLIESIPDEVCLKDLRHRYLMANRASMKALSVTSLKGLVGKTDQDFVPEALAQEHFAEEEAILKSGEPLINFERTKFNPNTGEIEKCLLTTKVPVKEQTGKTIGILVINRYITERRRAEEALRASEEKYRALFEESKDAVYISTADGRLLDINRAGIELFGYGSKEENLQIDLSRHSYVDPKDKERFDRDMEKDGFVKDFEVVLRRKDGEKLTVLETATAVRDKTGKIVQYRGIIRDVTKHRLLERQFIQAQKMESIGTLAGGIAHDFNNILGIVLGHLSLLERTKGNEAQFKESVSSINKAVERGASLVRQILTFARKAETQLEPVSINGTVKELAKMLQETLPKTIVVDLDLDKTIPIVSMDPTQLHQALLNLCVNARDAMDGQGTLKITTQLVRGDEVATRFPKARAKDYIRVGVADTGGGMDEETRRQIFEPFFTTKEKGRGTGLGLAVVYGVLQSHDGFIDVETALGVGTTFHLFIPVPEGILAIEPKQTEKPEDLPLGTETILVVEDENVLQKLLSQVLEMQGYKVYAAKDGEEAVSIFGEHKDEIALVLSDMGLPKRNGWDAFKMMKDQAPDIRVILASGYIDPGQASEVLKSGVKRFIHKPYRINEVLVAVRETLDAEA